MKRKKSSALTGKLLVAAAGCLALLIATFAVPRRGGAVDINDRGLGGGPDSYFRHIYDPQHLLGPLGQTDLELDNFQRATGNAILFAAFPALPSKDPAFPMQVAERWSPGKKADDRGVIVFLFMQERQLRVEVGYGYEDVLSDIATKRLIESTMIPLLRSGQTTAAVEAAARALQESLAGKSTTHREQTTLRSEWPGLKTELKRRAGLIARVWLHGSPLLRLLLGGLALGSVLWLSMTLLPACWKFGAFVHRAACLHDTSGAKEALGGLFAALIGLGQAALMVFLLGTMGEYFKSGTGMFGGGGVTLGW